MSNNIVDINTIEETEDLDKKLNVLVIGKGYIGSNLAFFLAVDEDNLEVHNIERNDIDYTDRDTLTNFLTQYQNEGINFDTIVNAVGFTGETNIDDGEDQKELAFLLNTVFPITLASVSQEFNIPKVINIMSGCIFDGIPDSDKEESKFTEESIPNFGMFDDKSSFYSKTKHAAELITSTSFNNVINFRIRMPISEIPSKRNLINKLLTYKTILNHNNSVTYLFDLFNIIYNTILLDYFVSGVYNVVNPGIFKAEDLIDVLKEFKSELENCGLAIKDHLDEIELVDIEKWNELKLTKANRSNTLLNGNLISEYLNIEMNEMNKDFYRKIIENLIQIKKEELVS